MNRFILLIIVLSMGLLAACGGGGSSSAGGSATTLASVSPGDTLPLGTTVSASASGTYNLPAGAQIITTRCIGQVTLAIPGAAQNNTCNSATGSSSQTNAVAGVGNVTYTFGQGSSAQVTVN